MKKFEYLADRAVSSFLEWSADLVGGRRPLERLWHSPQGSGFTFQCKFLREAYEKYQWPMVGATKRFPETARLFDRWQTIMANRTLWSSSPAGARNPFREEAIEVTRWGRMPQVRKDLEQMGQSEMEVLFANARLLDPASGDADLRVLRTGGIRYMNSGYSKIYAMMLESFPIYDSRVACALTSLIVTVQTCGDLRAIRPLTEGQPSTEFALQADSSPQT